mmetsp:Transcript_104326/g.185495  ORF Transcript_104326/g.185495 Transcript_104326/m.185495 type:complete len:156 (+) Transcript_104326:24-491(+)
MELPFPSMPPFPPTLENRGTYIHWWLCVFMTGVGALKAAGFLRHDLSQLVGVLELIGGCVFLPRWTAVTNFLGKGGSERSLRLGCWMVLCALGMIMSTYKRKSMVCWTQAFLSLDLLRSRGGTTQVWIGVAMLTVGTAAGLGIQEIFPQWKIKPA